MTKKDETFEGDLPKIETFKPTFQYLKKINKHLTEEQLEEIKREFFGGDR